ncbi:DUF7860 family protein [Halegenticoccus tardaugens]|uniref:DUF7860 family protein n=1 Tax=Halegenticoccus tardaugens TaxID=2071624 RepID=UPI00100AAD8A|nr:hypothetical protein [Halegenticoccus tardaugens]
MTSRYGTLDYPFLTKAGFGLGVALFVVGALGQLVGHAVLHPMPGWEEALFFDLELLGIVLGLLSPFVFGIFLPLTE